MITLQLEVDISEDRRLTIQLPENCQTGKHQVVVVLNPEDTSVPTLEGNPLNAVAGKIQSFTGIDAVAKNSVDTIAQNTQPEKASTAIEESEAFQAFLESVAERKEVYQRLADS